MFCLFSIKKLLWEHHKLCIFIMKTLFVGFGVVIPCNCLVCNGIVLFGVVVQCICLVQCCHTMELFGLVLSDNGIVWFNRYNLYNFCCPRVTHNPSPTTPPGTRRGGPFRAGEESCVGERVMKKLWPTRGPAHKGLWGRGPEGLVECCHTMELFGLIITTCIIFVVLE